MFNYVYMIKDVKTDEFYIGVRSCSNNPIDDIYMGSMKTWARMETFNKDNLRKRILSTYSTREEAANVERELIKLFINDPLNRNYYIPDLKFCTKGLIGKKSGTFGRKHSEETRKRLSEISKNRKPTKVNIVLDLNTGVFYDSLKESWRSLHNQIPFGTFYHRYKHNNYYKNLLHV